MPTGLFTPRRIAIGVLCVAAFAVCCGLAWWQWNRFESASGSFQNLGYVLQWPLFGVFPAFMVWRIWKLRREAAAQEDAEPAESRAEWGRKPVSEVPSPRTRQVPVDDQDDELAAYNRYLAELHARDQRES
ncbi:MULTISPECIES: hypothetical protein [Amycolatopsis]|uniref:DNA-binding transcriptional regulator of glucitol operon n=2 Tax=Amycolatopsis methanolica group TaxID=2893674 RepID=A0A076MVX5_AMYME|nr:MULTISPECIES: hypothetical protein [Amycolatopsis methanolica group]AIJ24968.1 hypothetical protein AMETH_4876 [Amycolatopsis methanolica 239]ROS43139.1 DNA-binding transcriptional regulator of glucitol operon [Amycolatopsis thermoflava]